VLAASVNADIIVIVIHVEISCLYGCAWAI